MALYTIGDLHLSETAGKPMDVFGGVWRDYRQKIIQGFSRLEPEDVTVLCGDFSWGINLEEALADFRLVDSFPGKKILVKGNHDLWWQTVSKMNKFFEKNSIKTLSFLHNNCIFYNGTALCGTRGWFYDPADPAAAEEKVFRRELIRLEASLCAARAGLRNFLFSALSAYLGRPGRRRGEGNHRVAPKIRRSPLLLRPSARRMPAGRLQRLPRRGGISDGVRRLSQFQTRDDQTIIEQQRRKLKCS